MEKLGFTLSSYINSFQKFPSSTIVEIGLQLLDRLEILHYEGYVHLDLKPSNIIFSQDKTTLYLIDFGFATKLGSRNNDKKFKGNLLYSSKNCMKCGEYTIFDDI